MQYFGEEAVGTTKDRKVIRRVTLSDTVIEELRKMIVANLKPGDRLPTENELAAVFSVGRSSIREGLKVLSALGIVERRNEGTFVSKSPNVYLVEPLGLMVQMEVANFTDILEMRELLELVTVRLAVARATEEDIEALEKLVWEMEKPGLQTDEFIQADIEFHSTLAGAARNAALGQFLYAVRTVLVRFQERACSNPKIQEHALVHHRKLVQAIRRRNVRLAQKLMEEHLKVARVFHGVPEEETEKETGKEIKD